MRHILFLTALLLAVSGYCRAGDYKKVTFGPYTDSAQEDSRNGNLAPLIEDFRGAAAPKIFLTGRRRAFSFQEDMSGVSTISITGPYGVVYQQHFSPPIKSTGLAVYDLPAGDYRIRSYNSVGGLSENLICISEIGPEFARGGSYAD